MASANRLPVTAEDILRSKRNGGGTAIHLKRSSVALIDTTNLPSKRQRLSRDNDNDDDDYAMTDMHHGRKTLKVAPDWGGGEVTSTPAPFSSTGQTQILLAPPASTPAAYRNTSNPLSLSHPKWGLKREVVLGFGACGITEMYPWQSECLSLPGLLSGEQNLVYTAPTSAGKSLVADVLAIRQVIAERKKAIIVVPYIAIVQEKTKFLKKVLEKVRVMADSKGHWDKQKRWRSVNIVGFHSGAKSRLGWKELDLAVCTIEKANALINAAIEDCSIDHLGVVVFDELHMLGDPHRGPILELLATKILCLSEEHIQIVGMSATLANVHVLAAWLHAQAYECTYRPIPLREHYVVDNAVYAYNDRLTARIPLSELKELKDPVTNAVITLAFACVKDGHGVLVFCESRRRCEDMSLLLIKFMPRCDDNTRERRMEVVRDLATTTTGLDFVLERTVPAGVAFHHAGLTTEEKDLIADAYDRGLVKIICCTATMAAGVNLPARRVIISPRMGRDFVSPAMLRQMKGRAGRKGKDTVGESFLVCRKSDIVAVKALMEAKMPSVESCLAGEEGGLKRALLEGIATKLATSADSLDDYIRATLLFHTTADPAVTLRPIIAAALEYLKVQNLITEDTHTGYFEATKIGNATVASGFGPDEGVFLHQELSRALRNFNLECDMHIVYQFTPIHSSSTQAVEIDWKVMRDEVEHLDEHALRAATFVGVNPGFVNRMAQGGALKEDTPANIEKARVYRRFYVSLMLRELINERPVHVVAANYDIARGFIQQLSSTCRGFATTSATFCKVMGWTGLAVLLEHYSWRLDLGVKDDLMELARIPFVKSYTARVFYENGLKTIEAVAAADVSVLRKALEMAQPKRLRLRQEEEVKMAARLQERAEIVLAAARRIYEQECVVELEE
ncbi:hypothetical protein Q9L58_008851 [Maublancomyces gigas]|uniref:P-loop containing nucleoside triphosphate hydrolase protein n=1 Tax=Discina gigas TaxID=1032678 RepID=A0ABR3G902_9PEZI